ncbi:hypothetical protein SAMN02990966_01527 [Rhodospirillales bacterium URHD0017]|nr:hypothetical protein SAMN02990966_01527 [Rhodospirillales bacterium URHD0017]
MSIKRLAILIAIVVVGLIALGRTGTVLVDWLWFSSIGYVGVFWTIITTRAVLFLVVLAVSAGAFFLSGGLALRFAGQPAVWPPPARARPFPGQGPQNPFELLGYATSHVPWRLLVAGIAVLLGLLTAVIELSNWDVVLRFLYQVPYGASDPVFGKDIGFFLFSLPAYVALKNWLLLLVVFSAAIAGLVYWAHGDIELDKRPRRLSRAVLIHASALLGLYFAVKAWSYGLDRYQLLYSDNGVVVGAGYTDLHVRLPVLWLLAGLAIACAVACWVNMRWRTWRIPAGALALLFGSSFVLYLLIPSIFQRLYVKPSELELETPYIARNIASTQQAYNLQQIAVKPFPVEEGLSLATLEANRATVDNIRLWDWQPLMDTYAQLQEIRTYYKFLDMDIDRYRLGGAYQQVLLSARELEPSLLPSNAQTWVNLHVLFTHGNGVVMSPVTRKNSEGLPVFYLQDIPPVATGGPAIREPRLYFGQGRERYAIVKGTTPEFDYPKGKDNVYASYDGADGVAIGDPAWRGLFSWYYSDPNIMLSSYVTNESRILLHRNIQDRVRTIAPVLSLDHDPYIVVSDGRLFWMQDAYTTSDWFPYAQPQSSGGLNYMRNSVKVVIDAYNGSVDFYVSEPGDPLIQTYQRVFPGLFKPLAAMPADLQQHIRYPEDLFLVQAQLYRAYHMDTPEVFYNREDLWQFPRQASGVDSVGNREVPRMAPYYMIMRLPGEARAELVLMLPMVPSQRENMIAWLAARCDPPDYGKVVVYEFPKDKLVFGPFQIEARIQQNTEISQQISLWNQMGSRVIRGHLLVVPIENSILYVSPLYLRAATGQLPELKRVIAAYGDRVVMEETLGAALAALFKDTATPLPRTAGAAAAGGAGPPDARAREALAHYERAVERLKAGDWSGFGAELDALRPLLEALGRPPNGR